MITDQRSLATRQPFSAAALSGLGYASFFLGYAGGLLTAAPGDLRVGSHAYTLYLQDTSKVTLEMTLELGLRWDYANLWQEEHGRMQSADSPTGQITANSDTLSPERRATPKTQTEPPSGTERTPLTARWIVLFIPFASPPQPESTARYCLPSD